MDALFETTEEAEAFVKQASGAAEPKDFDAEIAAVVKRLNKKYTVVNEGGKAVIFQGGYDPLLKRRRIDRLTPRDMQTLYMNEKVQTGFDDQKRPVYKTVSNIWLSHPERRQFIEGVTFDPTTTKSKPGILNLWEGFAIEPAPGDWSLMRAHIKSIICDSDDERFNYLMGWMARMLQRPAEQGEVAVVMKGGEGTGKGTLAKALLKILGQHGLAISNAKHLIGNFNGHLRDAIMLFADEAFFAGDRAHVGVLKSIITEPYLTVEAKFQNAIQMPNFLHVMMASNEEWVVPASLDARRFFVLEVVDAAKNDHKYFGEIWAQMDAGGYAAMLQDLLAYDLTHFNVRAVPATEGLQQQRKLSLPIPESWWKDCLERGYVFQSKLGLEKVFAEWHDVISTELMFASYSTFAEKRHERHPLSREHLGRFIRRMGGKPSRPRNLPVGEHITDEVGRFGEVSRSAKPIGHPRPPAYSTGSLSDARLCFEEATGLTIEWEAKVDGD
ncbi:primase-helicase family protein [Acidisoma cladoniae]|uniref:primase-helicase family protein n=1 Tax=Acidisoma cladoniae TaxID=3040935 RepID=UPI00255188D5|nr:primase-helicase family protein [Acidisoma sp. PAMC 29798]